MKKEYVTYSGITYLKAEGVLRCPLYMVYMMQRARPPGFLTMKVTQHGLDMKTVYHIGERISLKEYFTRNGAGREDFLRLLEALECILKVSGEYLLDENHILLQEEYLFYDGKHKEFHMMFSPYETAPFRAACRKFVTYLLGNYFTGRSMSEETWRNRLLSGLKSEHGSLESILDEARKEDSGAGEKEKPLLSSPPKLTDKIRDWLQCKANRMDHTRYLGKEAEGWCLIHVCDASRRIPLKGDGITLGRDVIARNNREIGRVHARIFFSEDKTLITDLGSRNGTYINGELLDKHVPYEIERGDIIGFSEEEFMLC